MLAQIRHIIASAGEDVKELHNRDRKKLQMGNGVVHMPRSLNTLLQGFRPQVSL